MGLNAFNVHKNGAAILKVGCSPAAIAVTIFDMPPFPEMKQQELDFNDKACDTYTVQACMIDATGGT